MLIDEEVVVHEILGDNSNLRRLVLKGPIADEAKPGQFVHVRVAPTQEPLLRRPLSIFQIDAECEEITVLYRVQGRGTELLAEVPSGAKLSLMGPLGRGFSVPNTGELWLIAGGIGIFPLYALAQAAQASGITCRLFWGGENKDFIENAGLKFWQDLNIPIEISTMDGSLGAQGLVTAPFANALDILSKQNSNMPVRVAACGPKVMLQRVNDMCLNAGIEAEVSLEERMGCAVGACLGCVVTLRNEKGNLKRAKVCQDGPVFDGREVAWDVEC